MTKPNIKFHDVIGVDELRYRSWASGKPDPEITDLVRAYDAKINPRLKAK